MKRFISLIIALAMVFTLTSQAFAQDSLTADAIRFGQDGKLKITWSVMRNSTLLLIKAS